MVTRRAHCVADMTKQDDIKPLWVWDSRRKCPRQRYGVIAGRHAFIMARPDSHRADVVPAATVYASAIACRAKWHSTQKVFVVPRHKWRNEPDFEERLMVKNSRRRAGEYGKQHDVVSIVSGGGLSTVDASMVFTTRKALARFLITDAKKELSERSKTARNRRSAGVRFGRRYASWSVSCCDEA